MRTQTQYNEQQAARAVYFTACVFLGRGKFETREFKTEAEARAAGAGMGGTHGRPVMYYAVTPEGFSIPLD